MGLNKPTSGGGVKLIQRGVFYINGTTNIVLAEGFTNPDKMIVLINGTHPIIVGTGYAIPASVHITNVTTEKITIERDVFSIDTSYAKNAKFSYQVIEVN